MSHVFSFSYLYLLLKFEDYLTPHTLLDFKSNIIPRTVMNVHTDAIQDHMTQ